jgi:hypothetical protein
MSDAPDDLPLADESLYLSSAAARSFGSSRTNGAGNAARHQWQRRPIPAEVLSPASRPNELAAAARGALIDPRDREILSRRLGLDGIVPQTLRMSEGVRDAFSCGNPVEPAAEADERASGPEDIADPVQQPAPAAHRPRVGKVGDHLLHQRA